MITKISTWKCNRCDCKLPKKGTIWAWRFSKHTEGEASGFFCDTCADARESGMEY